MTPMEAARSIIVALSDKEKEQLSRELGFQLSACQRLGHKFKELVIEKHGNWINVMFCERCGDTRKVQT